MMASSVLSVAVYTDVGRLDAWPLGKRLHHIIDQLRVDEWKLVKTGAPADTQSTKESKMDKLDTLIRIVKNTADIDSYYPKEGLIAW